MRLVAALFFGAVISTVCSKGHHAVRKLKKSHNEISMKRNLIGDASLGDPYGGIGPVIPPVVGSPIQSGIQAGNVMDSSLPSTTAGYDRYSIPSTDTYSYDNQIAKHSEQFSIDPASFHALHSPLHYHGHSDFISYPCNEDYAHECYGNHYGYPEYESHHDYHLEPHHHHHHHHHHHNGAWAHYDLDSYPSYVGNVLSASDAMRLGFNDEYLKKLGYFDGKWSPYGGSGGKGGRGGRGGGGGGGGGDGVCRLPIDIAFLFDGTAAKATFTKFVEAAVAIVKRYNVSKTETRVAALTSMANVRLEFAFDRYFSDDEMEKALTSIDQGFSTPASPSTLTLGLEKALTDLFTVTGRDEAYKTLIVFMKDVPTGAFSDKALKLKTAAVAIHVIAENAVATPANTIASKKNEWFSHLNGFDNLDTTVVPKVPSVTCRVDLVFIVDCANANKDTTDSLRNFMQWLTRGLDIEVRGDHVALVLGNGDEVFHLKRKTTAENVNLQLDSFQCHRSASDLGAAFDKAVDVFSRTADKEAIPVAVFVTGGTAIPDKTKLDNLHMFARVYAIGYNRQMTRENLKAVASSPSSHFVHSRDSVADVASEVGKILEKHLRQLKGERSSTSDSDDSTDKNPKLLELLKKYLSGKRSMSLNALENDDSKKSTVGEKSHRTIRSDAAMGGQLEEYDPQIEESAMFAKGHFNQEDEGHLHLISNPYVEDCYEYGPHCHGVYPDTVYDTDHHYEATPYHNHHDHFHDTWVHYNLDAFPKYVGNPLTSSQAQKLGFDKTYLKKLGYVNGKWIRYNANEKNESSGKGASGGCHFDIAFLFDGSAPVDVFNKFIDAALAIVDRYTVSESETHIGAITYSNKGVLNFGFHRYLSNDAVKEGLNGLKQGYTSVQGRALDKGLKVAASELFNISGRPEVYRSAIVFLDGDPANTYTDEATTLKRLAVSVHVTGISMKVTHDLLHLPSTNKDWYMHLKTSYDDIINDVAQTVPNVTCRVDLEFIVDCTSPNQRVLESIKSFMKKSIANLDIGIRKDRVALVTFGANEVKFNLAMKVTKEKLLSAIDDFSCGNGGAPEFDTTILQAEEVFVKSGDKEAIPVAVFVTGRTEIPNVSKIYQLKNAARVYVVAYNPAVNEIEMRKVASSPSSHFLYIKDSIAIAESEVSKILADDLDKLKGITSADSNNESSKKISRLGRVLSAIYGLPGKSLKLIVSSKITEPQQDVVQVRSKSTVYRQPQKEVISESVIGGANNVVNSRMKESAMLTRDNYKQEHEAEESFMQQSSKSENADFISGDTKQEASESADEGQRPNVEENENATSPSSEESNEDDNNSNNCTSGDVADSSTNSNTNITSDVNSPNQDTSDANQTIPENNTSEFASDNQNFRSRTSAIDPHQTTGKYDAANENEIQLQPSVSEWHSSESSQKTNSDLLQKAGIDLASAKKQPITTMTQRVSSKKSHKVKSILKKSKKGKKKYHKFPHISKGKANENVIQYGKVENKTSLKEPSVEAMEPSAGDRRSKISTSAETSNRIVQEEEIEYQ